MPLVVSNPKDRIILGLMTFGPDAEAGARITDPAEFNKALDVFQARGYNEVDTARVYVARKQEAFTREAKWRERGLTLATKIAYPNAGTGDNNHDKVIESAEISLKELGTDCVDVSGQLSRLLVQNQVLTAFRFCTCTPLLVVLIGTEGS
jgi:aflatoxin B1 aldehyde reductase